MKEITSSDFAEFGLYLQEEEKSQATVKKYLRDVIRFSDWCKDADITKSKVLEYKLYMKSYYAPSTVNSIVSSLNSFFAYKEWYELKTKSIKIQRQIFSGKERELTKAEYQRLLACARDSKQIKLFLLMETICSSGIRISELEYITAEAVKNCRADINCKGKVRTVLLPKQLCVSLGEYAEKHNIKSGPVFVTRSGKPLDRSNIWRMMKNLCSRAGVPKEKVYPHNFRHLFARTYYSFQKDIVRLADILGHSSINTTRIYTMESGDIHRRQIQNLGLLYCISITN